MVDVNIKIIRFVVSRSKITSALCLDISSCSTWKTTLMMPTWMMTSATKFATRCNKPIKTIVILFVPVNCMQLHKFSFDRFLSEPTLLSLLSSFVSHIHFTGHLACNEISAFAQYMRWTITICSYQPRCMHIKLNIANIDQSLMYRSNQHRSTQWDSNKTVCSFRWLSDIHFTIPYTFDEF